MPWGSEHMNVQALRSLGIALLLALGLVAAWLALGVVEPAGVGADDCANGSDMHEDFHENACGETGHDTPHENVIEVDGGRDSPMDFRFYPPLDGNDRTIATNDRIEIVLPDFDFANAVDSDAVQGMMLVEIAGSKDGTSAKEHPETVTVDKDNREIALTFDPEFTVDADEFVIVFVKTGTGILPPETPRGFDREENRIPVDLKFNDVTLEDKNYVVVKNPISSTVPGATVRIDLQSYANVPIPSNEEIVIDFSGPSEDASFGLPTTIAKTRIKIRSKEDDRTITFDPADVLVQGDKVTLTVPEEKEVAEGDFSISISQLARIKNPFAAGNRVINVSSFARDYKEDEITAVIRRTTTVRPVEGPRGSEFTLEGKGYAQGTVTVFDGEDETIDAGETLASVKTSRGSFATRLTARGNQGETTYKVWTRDSNGAIHSAVFDIRSSMSFEPFTVGIGERLKIAIVDWEDEHQEVAAVRIGGEDAFSAPPVVYANCFRFNPADVHVQMGGTISFDVTVPVGVPHGEQTVAVYGHEQLEAVGEDGVPIDNLKPCADLSREEWGGLVSSSGVNTQVKSEPIALVEKTIEIEIVTESLTLSAAAAVRGQRVTVTGSGFTQRSRGDDCADGTNRGDFCSVTIYGKEVVEDVSEFEVSTTGNFAFKVTVPLDAPIGDNEVQVEGWDNTLGQATLEVLGAAITLDRAQSRRGTTVGLTGMGFIANQQFRVSYGDGGGVSEGDMHLGSGRADASGRIEFEFDVPLTAPIGRVQRVTVVSGFSDEGPGVAKAEAEHTVPAGLITTTPYRVSSGDRLTIKGKDLPAFSLIRSIELEGRDITPVPNPSTDRDGEFEVEVLVPVLEFGDLMLRIDASGVLITHIVEVGPPPLSGDPAEVFKELMRDGVLVRVWRLDPATQEWFFFDPRPEFADFNTLETVARETVVVLIVGQDAEFRGEPLSTGSNYVFLD